MTKVRRGGYVFLGWKGDHLPRHVHVYQDGRLVVKWDIEHWRAIEGTANRRIVNLIEALEAEGRL